ncbi:Alanine--tRNA ligase, partial [Balamuthia mandrillaris]
MRSLLFGPGRCGGSGEAVLQRLSPPPFKHVHASFLHRHRNLSTSVSATKDIRSAFTDYFKSHGHVHLPSSSLIPHGDDTLLFTNAGMVQFKDHFLGKSPPPHPRLTTVQKCLRAGGKHNDLDNVGHTPRHHTFFEMLGNFSFGDYFKEEAIALAWTFLTKELGLPKERLLVSVHDKDEEAAKIWSSRQGISDDRILRLGDKDNFWSMGDGPGPCGPCTEIYWDQGDAFTGDDRY